MSIKKLHKSSSWDSCCKPLRPQITAPSCGLTSHFLLKAQPSPGSFEPLVPTFPHWADPASWTAHTKPGHGPWYRQGIIHVPWRTPRPNWVGPLQEAETFFQQDSICDCRSPSPAAFRQKDSNAKAHKNRTHMLYFPLPEVQGNKTAAIPRKQENTWDLGKLH